LFLRRRRRGLKEEEMKKGLKRLAIPALAAAFGLAALSGCGGGADSGGGAGDKSVRVGSKTFTEGFILSELYALALEEAGYTVDRKYNLSNPSLALEEGEIDLYPEYTGTGLVAVLKEPPLYDAQEVYDKVKSEYLERYDIVWLKQADINDSQGLVITKKASDALGITTISDLQAKAGEVRFASQGGFDEREDGIPGLEKVYGPFAFKSHDVYDDSLKYQILRNDEADLAVAYTTEGNLVSEDFVVLEDDKHVWPPYYVAPIVRNDYLQAHPDVEEILNRVSDALDNEAIIALNAEVDIDKTEFQDAAKSWYEANLGA
jgi:osmoprotectant transport system substrate-binding protein